MRIRDHDKADLALAALTLSVTAAAAVSEAVRWVGARRRRAPSEHGRVRAPRHAASR
jgi:hypothetical protein